MRNLRFWFFTTAFTLLWAPLLYGTLPVHEGVEPAQGVVRGFALNQLSCYLSLLPQGHSRPVTLRAKTGICHEAIKGKNAALRYAAIDNPDCRASADCKFSRKIRVIVEIRDFKP